MAYKDFHLGGLWAGLELNPVTVVVANCWRHWKANLVWGNIGVDQITEKYNLHGHILKLEATSVKSND